MRILMQSHSRSLQRGVNMRDRYSKASQERFVRAFALHMDMNLIAGRSLASASSAARGPTNGIAIKNTLSALMPRIYKQTKKT